jgi:hypothetical protein
MCLKTTKTEYQNYLLRKVNAMRKTIAFITTLLLALSIVLAGCENTGNKATIRDDRKEQTTTVPTEKSTVEDETTETTEYTEDTETTEPSKEALELHFKDGKDIHVFSAESGDNNGRQFISLPEFYISRDLIDNAAEYDFTVSITGLKDGSNKTIALLLTSPGENYYEYGDMETEGETVYMEFKRETETGRAAVYLDNQYEFDNGTAYVMVAATHRETGRSFTTTSGHIFFDDVVLESRMTETKYEEDSEFTVFSYKTGYRDIFEPERVYFILYAENAEKALTMKAEKVLVLEEGGIKAYDLCFNTTEGEFKGLGNMVYDMENDELTVNIETVFMGYLKGLPEENTTVRLSAMYALNGCIFADDIYVTA